MMNTDGSGVTESMDAQQMISNADRETIIGRIATHFGNRGLAVRIDEVAFTRSGGKSVTYRRIVQAIVQQKNQQLQQQQQQQTMMNPQGQPPMYPQSQQVPMSGMMVQQSSQPSYAMQPSQLPASTMAVKQEPQTSLANIQTRVAPQNFSVQQQQQQQIKQELMQPLIQQQQQQQQHQQQQQQHQQQHQQQQQQQQHQQQHQQQQQIKQELMQASMQQQPSSLLQVQQMRAQQQQQQQSMALLSQQYMQQQQHQQQQTPSLPSQSMSSVQSQPRILPQHLQQVRQQSHLNQPQQQQDASNTSQIQQYQHPNHSAPPTQSSSGSQDEILQQLLSSPNPTKQPATAGQTALQARLRTMNRSVRQPAASTAQQPQASPMTPGTDPMMTTNSVSSTAVSSPHSSMMQPAQVPSVPPTSSSIARYMMTQSPQAGVYRPPMSPMTTINYGNSPTAIPDEEIQFLVKFFTERIQYLSRMIVRCQQEGQLDKIPKYRQLQEQIAIFLRNPVPEHLVSARRLKEHMDRIFGSMLNPLTNDQSTTASSTTTSNTRIMSNEIFEQCQRTIIDYLGRDSTLKYNIAKRFLEPLNEVLNGVPHKNIRLDTDTRQNFEMPSNSNNDDFIKLSNMIESEFAHLSVNTYSYELKPLNEKMSSSSMMKTKDSITYDYELTCRLIEINMPIVPPLKMKLTIQYPNEPPEILSLISTTMNVPPTKLENSDGNTFFESISRNFVYFLFKLPSQHTISDVLDIWRTAIRNASYSQNDA